jgi:DNA-binding NarL/FixJ family response regulator
MNGRRNRVVVAEDDLLVREGIVRVLESSDAIEVAAAVADLPALIDAVERHRPDVVVTDIRLPPTFTDEGLRFAAELWQREPGVGVVVLSQHVDPSYAAVLLDRGATGRAYVPKERVTDRDTIAAVVDTVARGGSHVDILVVEKLLEGEARPDPSTRPELTPREEQILKLVSEAKSNSAIARELGVTSRAVERHVTSIFYKLRIADSPDVSRRVRAALTYRAEHPE